MKFNIRIVSTFLLTATVTSAYSFPGSYAPPSSVPEAVQRPPAIGVNAQPLCAGPSNEYDFATSGNVPAPVATEAVPEQKQQEIAQAPQPQYSYAPPSTSFMAPEWNTDENTSSPSPEKLVMTPGRGSRSGFGSEYNYVDSTVPPLSASNIPRAGHGFQWDEEGPGSSSRGKKSQPDIKQINTFGVTSHPDPTIPNSKSTSKSFNKNPGNMQWSKTGRENPSNKNKPEYIYMNKGLDYDTISMSQLQKLAIQTHGYEKNAVMRLDRTSLIMIAKGYGNAIKVPKKSEVNEAIKDKITGVFPEQQKTQQQQPKPTTANNTSPRAPKSSTPTIPHVNSYTAASITSRDPSIPRGLDYDAMSVAQLQTIAKKMGYGPNGPNGVVNLNRIDRTGLLMIAKGYGHTVGPANGMARPATTSTSSGSASANTIPSAFTSAQTSVPKSSSATYTDNLGHQSQVKTMETERIRANVAAHRHKNYDTDTMSVPQLEKLANALGYDVHVNGVRVDRSGLVMIAKGMGRSVRGARFRM